MKCENRDDLKEGKLTWYHHSPWRRLLMAAVVKSPVDDLKGLSIGEVGPVLAGLVLRGKRNEHRKRKRPFAVGTAGVLKSYSLWPASDHMTLLFGYDNEQ